MSKASRWHPIAASHDLPYRHVFHAQLFGREFAVWRADDDNINVWENRCLHRGVRLSIGINDGRELKCQYHGWRYANRTAGCTYIPAHPADAPARTITNRTFPVLERYGLVWTTLEADSPAPEGPLAEEGPLLTLRGIPVNALATKVVEALRTYPLGTDLAGKVEVEGEGTIVLRSCDKRIAFFVQPVDADRCVIRGVVEGEVPTHERIAVLRSHNEHLGALRDKVERLAALEPAPAPIEPFFERVPAELAEMPPLAASGRKPALRVQVNRKWQAGEGIAAFELRPIKGVLPTFQPGAHIDVHMPNGEIRPYSVINGPGETDHYTIGVKLDAESKGGSRCMHESVREGDVLAISEPRNNFPLRRDAVRTYLIAGGIGITPLLAMAQTLHNQDLPFELHYFARGEAGLAFRERLAALGASLLPHLGLDREETAREIRAALPSYRYGLHAYLCASGGMLETARAIAAEKGWPEEAVHFEYFKNETAIEDQSSFEIALARSVMTLPVPAGRTILDVLREHGVDMPSSCEQGACGTCLASVIEGEPLHQDVYLTPAERRAGTSIITCVSRARSARLVLDL
ncbi:ferredoxin [Labrys miyagiensis]|uniref:Ferredoxin n=1 Tax=Labrys miyagiensis TaxID=346912 RepID=A0ABQ6CGL5_9HYPH|nr:Rieske 2Fe-2S domain-containing protein [Labrys miyagiensis]GLS19295.1 ferredoxin [Labrys miyagiensis]